MDIKHYLSTIIIAIGFIIFFILKFKYGNNALLSKDRFYEKQFNYETENIFYKIQIALEKAQFKNIIIDNDNSIITAESKFSMSSWGEIINIKIVEESNHSGKVIFTSICSYSLQIYDWGKNKDNFKKFYNQLNINLLQLT